MAGFMGERIEDVGSPEWTFLGELGSEFLAGEETFSAEVLRGEPAGESAGT